MLEAVNPSDCKTQRLPALVPSLLVERGMKQEPARQPRRPVRSKRTEARKVSPVRANSPSDDDFVESEETETEMEIQETGSLSSNDSEVTELPGQNNNVSSMFSANQTNAQNATNSRNGSPPSSFPNYSRQAWDTSSDAAGHKQEKQEKSRGKMVKMFKSMKLRRPRLKEKNRVKEL